MWDEHSIIFVRHYMKPNLKSNDLSRLLWDFPSELQK